MTKMKVAGSWRDVASNCIKVAGVWKCGSQPYYKRDGVWVPEGGSAPPITPGDYVLSASSLFLPGTIGQSGYAEFNTSAYRGLITDIKMRVSWGDTSSFNTAWSMGVSGRASGTFYRSVTDLPDWANRTITHNVASFNGNVVPQFNSGAAIGFGLTPQYTTAGWSLIVISTIRLVITV